MTLVGSFVTVSLLKRQVHGRSIRYSRSCSNAHGRYYIINCVKFTGQRSLRTKDVSSWT